MYSVKMTSTRPREKPSLSLATTFSGLASFSLTFLARALARSIALSTCRGECIAAVSVRDAEQSVQRRLGVC